MKKKFLVIFTLVVIVCLSANLGVCFATPNNSEKSNQGTLTLLESSGDFDIAVVNDINSEQNTDNPRFLPSPYKISAKFVSSNQFNFYFHNWGADPIDKVVIYTRVFYKNGNSYQAPTRTEYKILPQFYRTNKYFFSNVARVVFAVDMYDDGQKATALLELRR